MTATPSSSFNVDYIGEIDYSSWSHTAEVKVRVDGRTYTITKSKLKSEEQAYELLTAEEITKAMHSAKLLGLLGKESQVKSVDFLPGKAVVHRGGKDPKEYQLSGNSFDLVSSVREARVDHLKGKIHRYEELGKTAGVDREALLQIQSKAANARKKVQSLEEPPQKKREPKSTAAPKKSALSKEKSGRYEAVREKCLKEKISIIRQLQADLKKNDVRDELIEFIAHFAGDRGIEGLLAEDVAVSLSDKSISKECYESAVAAMIEAKCDLSLLINFSYREGLSSELLKNDTVKSALAVKGLAGELEMRAKETLLNGVALSLDGGRIGEGEILLSEELKGFAEASHDGEVKRIAALSARLTSAVRGINRLTDEELQKAVDSGAMQLFKGGFKDHAASVMIDKNKMVVCNRGAGTPKGGRPGYTIYTFDGDKVPLEALKSMYADKMEEFEKNQALLKAAKEEVELKRQTGNSCWLLSITPTIEIAARLSGKSPEESRALSDNFLRYRQEELMKGVVGTSERGWLSEPFKKAAAKALKNSKDPLWKELAARSPSGKEICSWH